MKLKPLKWFGHSEAWFVARSKSGRLAILCCFAALLAACASGDGSGEDVGTAQQAVCASDDVGCKLGGAPEWPRWSQQPNRPPAKFGNFAGSGGGGGASGGAGGAGGSTGGAAGSSSGGAFQVKACDPNLLGKLPATPNPKGADLQNISTNFHVLQSMQMVASILNKAVQGMDQFKTKPSAVDAGQETGMCVCKQELSVSCAHAIKKDKATLADCHSFCDAAVTGSDPCARGVLVWLPNDIQHTEAGRAKWALKVVKWLDELAGKIADGGFAALLGQLAGDLSNATEILAKIQCYIDLYTEGYHLGAYSEQRPELHMCVPWAGHGAYAVLGGNDWGIGGRYTSHNISKNKRAQARTGGFAVTIAGETLSVLPSLEFNIQVDGYKWFNREAPLGLKELGWLSGGGLSLSAAKKFDVFSLVDDSQLASLDTSGNGRVDAQEFLVGTYMPFNYTADGSNLAATWPRDAAKPHEPWEGKSAAVMAAALNLDIALKEKKKELQPIPLGVPGATLVPYFKLNAGAGWYDEAYKLRQRLQDMLNKHTQHKITNADFDRNMHPFQAPDVTAEAGTKISVKPEIGANLKYGVFIGKRLELGVTAGIGFSLDVKPGGSGGVVDLNTVAEKALVNSNPPENLECKPVFSFKDQTYCSSRLVPESTGNYGCTPLDSNNSCCLKFQNGTNVCIDDWTGMTQAYCDKNKLTEQTLRLFLKDKQVKQIKGYLSGTFTATWNANKTCDECKQDGTCNATIRTEDFPDVSACQKHGVCCLPVVSSPYGVAGSRSITNGTGTAARFLQPSDLAFDAVTKMLYVADRTAIRRIDLKTDAVTTIAGSSTAGTTDGVGTAARFSNISGLTQHAGHLYIVDRGARALRRLNLTSNQVVTLANATWFMTPRDVAIAGNGAYVTDSGLRILQRVDLSTNAVTTVAGTRSVAGNLDGIGTSAQFNEPSSIVSDGAGNLYITDTANHTVRRFEIAPAVVATVAGNGVAGSADGVSTNAQFTSPVALAIDSSGDLYIGEGTRPGRVRRLVPETGVVTTISGAAGTTWLDGLATSARFEQPAGLAVLSNGDIYASDLLPATVRKIAASCDSSVPGAVAYDVTEASCTGRFSSYRCVTETRSEATDWQGPGCHPLQAGFQSACGCSSTADCGAGETCDLVKKVCTSGGTPVNCLCSSGASPSCSSEPGRTCVSGACARRCSYNAATADTVCGAGQTCSPQGSCVPKGGVQFAEQVIWALKNPSSPYHAIATYGMTDIELILALNAGINIGLKAKLFKKTFNFTLFDWKRAWDIGSAAKAKFQPGLEATYQWDGSSFGLMSNYQTNHVTRYPTITSANDETSEFLQWCKDEMPLYTDDPLPPTITDVVSSVEDVVNFGWNIGDTYSQQENLCIDGRSMMDWLRDDDALTATFANGQCRFVGQQTGNRGSVDFQCQNAANEMLKHFGCLDTNRTATASALASGSFSGAVVNTSTRYFDVNKLMIDPQGDLEQSNLVTQNAQTQTWLNEVQDCFQTHYEDTVPCTCTQATDCTTGPGQTCGSDGTCRTSEGGAVAQCSVVKSIGVNVERCCGDGVKQGTEQCDDGNMVNGDGCSQSCLSESKGACCGATACSDLGTNGITNAATCRSSGGYFVNGYNCGEINQCGIAPTGSCVEADGTCHTPTNRESCDGVGGTFTVGGLCDNLPERITLVPGPEGQDASIVQHPNSLNSTNGNSPYVTAGVWTINSVRNVNRSLIRFDLSGIPVGSTIERARLSLYADPNSRLYGQGTYNTLPPGHSTHGGSNAFMLQRLLGTWQEGTVTWNNQPAATTEDQVLLPASTSNGQHYLNTDVTALVQDMVSTAGANHGFLLRMQNEGTPLYRQVTFASSDFTNASSRPRLEVVFRRP